ncbi:peroxiredoxin-like family protein [Flavisolibacter nicotianae]|uniref:peroxiredoxin-like family protein n=1 Tax=Flavisolibacter nicotianae TaxID=2364882 RepID=UPI000EB4C939|nr:peroxiredoxin-like family protein [Flavisolibacter nicotianae]
MKKAFVSLFAALVVLAAQAQKPEGLFINSKAPEFKLKDQRGVDVSLKELRKKGPVVLLFYRGNWCPFCNRELKAFQDSLALIQAKGAQVVAITPETEEGIDSTVKKTGAIFPILRDEDMKVASNYQVAFQVDDRTLNRYKVGGIDLLKQNAQKVAMLPVPAVYVINREGSVTFRYFDENYRNRVSVKEILKNIN